MIVLDASFLVKLVVEEEGSREARRLVREWVGGGEVLATVDIALAEALNAVWKHYRVIGDLDRDEAVEAAEDLLKVWGKLTVYQSYSVAEEAFQLALKEGVAVYDALYLQLALAERAGLATFDEKLARLAASRGVQVYP